MTLDPDTEQIVRRRMRERGQSFKEAVNALIREGAAGRADQAFNTQTASMGESVVNLDRALQMAGELEAEELLRRLRTGS